MSTAQALAVKRSTLYQVPLAEISAPRGANAREDFNKDELDSLAKDIELNGLIQPIVLRRDGDQFVLVAGERRLRAHKALKWSHIKATVVKANEEEAFLLNLSENLSRSSLNPLEVAKGIRKALNYKSEKELAKHLGRTQVWVNQQLRVLDLEPTLQKSVAEKKMAVSTAGELAAVPKEERQKILRSAEKKGNGKKITAAAVKAEKRVKVEKEGGKPKATFIGIKPVREAMNKMQEKIDAESKEANLASAALVALKFAIGERSTLRFN